MAHDVFISYKSEEVSTANWIKGQLEANGITCWMAPMSIPGGSDYAASIEGAIENCKYLVMVLSSKSQTSKWVKKEVNIALAQDHVTTLPFMIEQCELVPPFKFYFTDVQIYDASADKTQALSRMIEDILNNRNVPTVHPSVSPDKVSKLSGRTFKWIWPILALLIAVAGIAYVSGYFDTFSADGEDNLLSESIIIREDTDDATVQSTSAVAENTTSTAYEETMPEEQTTESTAAYDAAMPHDTRKTAAAFALSCEVTETLQNDRVFWYTFTTDSENAVYRICARPITKYPNKYDFNFCVTLYNGLGMNLEEFYVRSSDEAEYLDLTLDPNAEYFLRVTTDYWTEAHACGYALSVEPKPLDTGIDMESATEIALGQQYVLTLNSSFHDWLVFTPKEEDCYKFIVYNIDIKETVSATLHDRSGGNIRSLNVYDGKKNAYEIPVGVNEPVYLEVGLYDNDSNAEGTYIVLVEKG